MKIGKALLGPRSAVWGQPAWLLLVAMLIPSCGRNSSNQVEPATPPALHTSSPAGRREQIARFLTVWIVEKNVSGALVFFSPRAFVSPATLSEDCAGYIPSEGRRSPDAVRAGVKRFLQEWGAAAQGKDLASLLATNRLETTFEAGRWRAVNKLQEDRYLLLPLDAASLQSEDAPWSHRETTRKTLFRELQSGPLFVSLAVLQLQGGEAAFYAVWTWDAGAWRIIHLDMICS